MGEGWLALAVVLDLWARAVVGGSMANHLRAARVPHALAMAICQRQPAAGLMMQTDRGSPYGADRERQLLTPHGVPPRMSRRGHGWANAEAASFFHTLTTALRYLEDLETHELAQTAVFD
jgi:transposase InsO family protein